MSVGKESIQRAAAKKTVAAKAATTASKTTGKTAAKAAPEKVTQSVVTPMDSQEIQVKFLSGNKPAEEGKPVKIAEDLPVYLL